VAVNIFIPPELKDIEGALKRFVDAMVFKLRKNSHKGRWQDLDLDRTLKLLEREVDELREAIAEGNDVEILLESSDCANFAMIAAALAVEGKRP